jgi:hypothetical protein
LSQGLVTYIVLGSEERLKTLKLPVSNREEEYLFANFSNNVSCEKKLDQLVTNSCGNLIVLLPPSAFPNLKAKNALKKIAMLDLSAWGWFRFKEKKNFLQNIKKISTTLRNIPKLEQGIFFSKRLYFSVGGIGDFGSDPFKEISKRFYTRIDPQNPLPALIIRTTNLEIF